MRESKRAGVERKEKKIERGKTERGEEEGEKKKGKRKDDAKTRRCALKKKLPSKRER